MGKKCKEPDWDPLSIGERRASLPPGTVQLPVPGPGGFGQLTRPPGETHTDRDTQPQSDKQRETQRGRYRETNRDQTQKG